MKLYFRNSTPVRVWVAVMHYAPDLCGADGDWATAGWWEYVPGEHAWVIETNNSWVYYYAEAETGEVWAGPFGPMYVYHEAFDSCLGIGSTAAYGTVGLREVFIDDFDNYTLNLIL